MYYIQCIMAGKKVPFCQLHMFWDGWSNIPFEARFLCGHPTSRRPLEPLRAYLIANGIKAKILHTYCPTMDD